MSRLFEITEIGADADLKTSEKFIISDDTPSNYNIIRLLIGSISVTNLITERQSTLNTNYLKLFYNFNDDLFHEENIANILNDSIDVIDLEKFYFDIKYKNQNKDFFIRLENEICNFLTYQEKESYTTAFVFLYRILEVISFSFPLIYASKTYDFKHTYGTLKDIFDLNNGQTKGELGFFKSAIRVIFKDADLLDTSIDINIDDPNFEISEKIHNAIKSIFPDGKVFHSDTVENSVICIKFGEVSSFIITIRNRFFHLFNRGDKNLESIEVIDSDYFFSKINEPLFSWICVIYIEINKFLLEEHIKYK